MPIEKVALEDLPVSFRFTVEAGGYKLVDALVMTLAERAAMTDAEFDARAQARFDAFVARLQMPPAAPTAEEKAAQIAALTQQQQDTQRQILAMAPEDVMLGILQEQLSRINEQIAAIPPDTVPVPPVLPV